MLLEAIKNWKRGRKIRKEDERARRREASRRRKPDLRDALLEDRVVPADFFWIGGGPVYANWWGLPANWQNLVFGKYVAATTTPGPSDTAIFTFANNHNERNRCIISTGEDETVGNLQIRGDWIPKNGIAFPGNVALEIQAGDSPNNAGSLTVNPTMDVGNTPLTYFSCNVANPSLNDPNYVTIQLDGSATAPGYGGKLVLDSSGSTGQQNVGWVAGNISNDQSTYYKGDFILDNIYFYDSSFTTDEKLGVHMWIGDKYNTATGAISADQASTFTHGGMPSGKHFWLGDGADIHVDKGIFYLNQDNHAGNVRDGLIETNTTASEIIAGAAGIISRTQSTDDPSVGEEVDCDILVNTGGVLSIDKDQLLFVRGQGATGYSVKNAGGTLVLSGEDATLDVGVNSGNTRYGYDQTSGTATLDGGSTMDGLWKFEGGAINMDTVLTSPTSGQVNYSGELDIWGGTTVNMEIGSKAGESGWCDSFKDVTNGGGKLNAGTATSGWTLSISYDGANPPAANSLFDLFVFNGGNYVFQNFAVTAGYTFCPIGSAGWLKKN
jgi:hypothetical protein